MSSSSSSSMSNQNNNNNNDDDDDDCHRKEGMSSREESVTQKIQTSTTTTSTHTSTTQNTVSSGGSSTPAQDVVTPAVSSAATASAATTTSTSQGISKKLTPEQLERIRINRDRALKIRAERKRQQQQQQAMATSAAVVDHPMVGGSSEPPNKKPKADAAYSRSSTALGSSSVTRAGTTPEIIIMEDWEVGLSDFVTKKEAVAKYCLPEGTLAVCQVTEKENPHHKGWAPMKLYHRNELRERAYRRFGGREGLIQERQKRENRRLAKDLKDADNIFA